jgi:hypothetical protein|tara:strand:+ start:2115 stop:2693 length:579 start_codon:yes stop_codon:yes gene_type:complete
LEKEKMELINFISVYDNILPEKSLDKLLKICKNLDWEDASVGENSSINKDIRKVKMCILQDIDNSMTNVHWYNVMRKVFSQHIQNYTTNNKIETIYHNRLDAIQILKYNKTDYYTWHIDAGPAFNRVLSCIFFINEDYEGGELCFKNPDGKKEFSIPKKKNRMVVWPSSFLYPHTVKPVTKGERYSIVTWTV